MGHRSGVEVYLVWLSDASEVQGVLEHRGPWREVLEAGAGLLLVDSNETLSRVYHEVKGRVPHDCAVLVAPLSARPKARGLVTGAATWLRQRLPLPRR